MVTIFFDFTKPTAQFIKLPYQFYSDCGTSALSFYKMHTVFACLHIYLISIHKHVYVCKRLIEGKKNNRTVHLQYSLIGTKVHYVDHRNICECDNLSSLVT